MKKLLLLLFLTPAAFGQLAVYDPANHLVNLAIQSGQAANQAETLRQWAAQLEGLNRQIQQLDAQLTEQQHIRQVMGDPPAAGSQIGLPGLGTTELTHAIGETAAAVRRLANAAASLANTADGIFQQLDNRTVLGSTFTRQEPVYLRYAAVERQAGNLADAQTQTDAQTLALQGELAATLQQLRTASTQAEVDKLNVKVTAVNGQLAHLDAQRRNEAEKLSAQKILNDNQAAKESQDLLEKQIAEERQTFTAVGTWQQSVKLTPTNYQQP